MTLLRNALRAKDSEWDYIVDNYMKPKCRVLGYCPEKFSCGMYSKTGKNIGTT